MGEVFQDPTPFSKGINLKDLMSSGSEFSIDMDFQKQKKGLMLDADCDLIPDSDDDDDSDSEEDVLKTIAETAEKKLLSSPQYLSFEDLASRMIDVLPSGDVKMNIIEEGDGPLVPMDAEVTIHYAAYWEKATIPFDSTLAMNNGEPMRLRLNTGSILPGLEIGLTAVHGPTARLQLLLQPRVAWGPQGVPPRIRPEPVLFVVALYRVTDQNAGCRFNDLPSQEQTKYEVTMRTVTSLHAKAKSLFQRKKYNKCISDYQQSINVLNISRPEGEKEISEVKQLKITSLLNLAVCYSKLNKAKHVLKTLEGLDYLMDVDLNSKVMYYYGKAYEMLGKTELAIDYYQKALNIEPKNKDIARALERIDSYVKNSSVVEKEMWQNAFKADAKKSLNVDEDFQNGVRGMFEELAGKNQYAKFYLPSGLTDGELDCVKEMMKSFKGMILHEEGEGRKRKITVVKQEV